MNVLITGGSRGIGLRLAAHLLATTDYNISVTSRNPSIAISKLCERYGDRLTTCLVDHQDLNCLQQNLVANDCDPANFNILINNVGISQVKDFEAITLQDLLEMFAVNFHSAFLISQRFCMALKDGEMGRLINISSIAGQLGGIRQAHYCSSKAALVNLTKSIARKYSSLNFTANCICPSLVPTEMVEKEINMVGEQFFIEDNYIGRICDFDDINQTVSFLISPGASYITGQCLNLNGGKHMV